METNGEWEVSGAFEYKLDFIEVEGVQHIKFNLRVSSRQILLDCSDFTKQQAATKAETLALNLIADSINVELEPIADAQEDK